MNNNNSECQVPGECYGAFREYICTREMCSFFDSCRYYTTEETRENKLLAAWNNSKKINNERKNGNAFYEKIPNEAYFPFDFDPADEERVYTTSQMISIIAFILRLKRNSTLWKILSDRISGKSRPLASYAREEGITRQALHKRIGTIIAKILCYKVRKLTSDSRLEKLTPQEFHLYKLQQSDHLPEEYHLLIGCTKRELQQLEQSLEMKLFKFT